jgi:hypothetical protein
MQHSRPGRKKVPIIDHIRACRAAQNTLSSCADPSYGVIAVMHQLRASQRIAIELPVEIRWKSRAGAYRQARGKTGNISGSGLFIKVPVRPHPATPVTIKVLLPREVTQVPLELLCQGRVVRWSQRGKTQGLGAVIDEYELRPAQRPGPARKHPPKEN